MEKLTKTNVLWRLIWNKLQRLPVLVGGKIRGGNLLFVMLQQLDRTNKAFDFSQISGGDLSLCHSSFLKS